MKRGTKFQDLSNVSQGVIFVIFLFKMNLFDYIKIYDSNPRFSNERSQVFGQIMKLTRVQFSSKWKCAAKKGPWANCQTSKSSRRRQ